MRLRGYFIGCIIMVVQAFAQREYHFYSDQPESHRVRTLENEFTYNLSQVKDKLYINLKVAPQKKALTSGKPITFTALLQSKRKPAQRQLITDSYYNFDGKYYSFKLPLEIVATDSITIQISNENPDLVGRTDFVVKVAPDVITNSSVSLYDGNLDPIISNTMLMGQVVVPISTGGKKVYVRFYDYESQSPGAPNSELPLVRTYHPSVKIISSEVSFYLEQKGYYEFGTDSLFATSKTLAVQDNIFPKINKASELLKPLVYLTDAENYKNILSTNTPKKTLDDFWLGLVGNHTEVAKRVIRLYYQRVYDANEKFNAKTLGWKSDMGMAYILLGKPKVVKDNGANVVWSYDGGTEIRFAENSSGDYMISNYAESRDHFATAVDQIKKGNID